MGLILCIPPFHKDCSEIESTCQWNMVHWNTCQVETALSVRKTLGSGAQAQPRKLWIDVDRVTHTFCFANNFGKPQNLCLTLQTLNKFCLFLLKFDTKISCSQLWNTSIWGPLTWTSVSLLRGYNIVHLVLPVCQMKWIRNAWRKLWPVALSLLCDEAGLKKLKFCVLFQGERWGGRTFHHW